VKPITPIVPGHDLPVVEFAKDQPEYFTLPAHRTLDGVVVTRWQLSWRERLRVLLRGNLWLHVHTFNQPLQPVLLEVVPPEVGFRFRGRAEREARNARNPYEFDFLDGATGAKR